MINPTIFQFFHWYYPADGSLWNHAASEAKKLADLGITHVWLPPAFKSIDGGSGVGYASYDLFDLGEFDQKGSVRTKYGTVQEYIAAIEAFHQVNIRVLADVVFNQKLGADSQERVPVRRVDINDRNQFIGEPELKDIYTLFNFPGRKGKYSSYIWDWHSFTGIDIRTEDDYGIYKILNEYGDSWDPVFGTEFGNYDYLMGADIEFRNPYVREELERWTKWFNEKTKIDGWRLDAAKHINPAFYKEWIGFLNREIDKDFFYMAEYWSTDPDILLKFTNTEDGKIQIIDVPLHYNFFSASKAKRDYDMKSLFQNTLIASRPELTISFVDNHDTQPMQSLESTIEDWFRPIAYAICLLRLQGIPCVFYPYFYGAQYDETTAGNKIHIELAPVKNLATMLKVRKLYAYGNQQDYFDHGNVVGWTREGIDEKPGSGLAVLISTGDDGYKTMQLGKKHSGKSFFDITGNCNQKVLTDQNGLAEFFVKAGSVSIWIREDILNVSGF